MEAEIPAEPGKTYKVRVRAINGIGLGDWSNHASITTFNDGSCANDGDLEIWRVRRATFRKDLSVCPCLFPSSYLEIRI